MMSSLPCSAFVFALLLLAPSGVRAAGDDIVLYANDWKTSYLTSLVAKQIINENILQDDDRSATVNYDITADRDTVLAFINDTAVPDASAALEIWDSAFQAEADDDHFDHLGEVGLVGRSGWYVPGYFVEQQPEATSWEFYTRNETAALLATEETEPFGRFLGMDPGKSHSEDKNLM